MIVIERGDSGLWVFSSVSNLLLGHINAGHPNTSIAYMCSMSDLQEDIERATCQRLRLPAETLSADKRQDFQATMEAMLRGLILCCLTSDTVIDVYHEPVVETSKNDQPFDRVTARFSETLALTLEPDSDEDAMCDGSNTTRRTSFASDEYPSDIYKTDAYTQSLPQELTEYPVHWGRSYHKYHEGSYHFPNDEPERSRLDLQHAIFNHYFGERLFFSPVDKSAAKEILDIGTGTGLWCIELSDANTFPNAQITGIDLSPIQPEMVPENVTFEMQDCVDSDWCRPLGSIDLIHSRFMAGSLESYNHLIRTAKKYLRPGTGWLELHEIHPKPVCDDGTMPPDWKFAEWESKLNYASKKYTQTL